MHYRGRTLYCITAYVQQKECDCIAASTRAPVMTVMTPEQPEPGYLPQQCGAERTVLSGTLATPPFTKAFATNSACAQPHSNGVASDSTARLVDQRQAASAVATPCRGGDTTHQRTACLKQNNNEYIDARWRQLVDNHAQPATLASTPSHWLSGPGLLQ